MCLKLLNKELNYGPYPPHPTSIYTCGVTTTPMVRGGTTTLLSLGNKMVAFLMHQKMKGALNSTPSHKPESKNLPIKANV